MAFIVASYDCVLKIPANFKGLTGKEPLTIEFHKGEPKEVSDKIAKYYVSGWEKKFKYAGQPEPEPFYPPDETKTETPPVFDPNKFLEDNFLNITEAIEPLKKKELIEICKVLRLKDYVTQPAGRIKDRIIKDIETKQKHEEELSKNKPVQDGKE